MPDHHQPAICEKVSERGTQMNKNTIQTEATKQAFVDALCQLACKKPVARVTVKEISDKAGYNRSTFYQYF